MSNTEYHLAADKILHEILEFLEELEQSYDISPELESGVLSLEMPDGRQYVINKHAPSGQIWVSSPYSGASYFEPVNGSWLPKRAEAANGRDLFQFIGDEIKAQLGISG